MSARHVGRSWTGHPLEDACPCPQERCGLVSTDRIVPDCSQHGPAAARTIRQSHPADQCSAVMSDETAADPLTPSVLTTVDDVDRWTSDGHGDVMFAEDGDRERWLVCDVVPADEMMALRWAGEDEYAETGTSGITSSLVDLPLPVTIWGAR